MNATLQRRQPTNELPASPRPDASATELTFALLVTAAYLAISIFNVTSHVLWRDEWRWWQFAVASPTFADMRTNMQFEGTPCLWYGALWLLSRLTANPAAMQLAHVVTAAGTVFLFVWRAPFSRLVRLLFPFGYFAFFEYAVISRNYAIVFLLTTAAAATIAAPRRRPIVLTLVLGLLTQTSIWGAGLAVVLLASALAEWYFLQPLTQRPAPRYAAASTAVVLGGCIACYLASLPGPGESFIARWPAETSVGAKLFSTVGNIWNGWVPWPRSMRNFWNTNVLDEHPVLRFIASSAMVSVAVLTLLRRPAALVVLFGGLAGLMAFTYLKFTGATRHQGLLYVVLVAACWIGATSSPVESPWQRLSRIAETWERRRNFLLAALLGGQALSGVGACIADHVLPFSAGKQIAKYLDRELPADAVLVGYDDYTAAPIGAYSNRLIYSVQMDALPLFFSQDDRIRRQVTIPLLVECVERVRQKYQCDVVVMLAPNRDDELLKWRTEPSAELPWRFLARFDDSTVADEGAVLYLAPRGSVYSGLSDNRNSDP